MGKKQKYIPHVRARHKFWFTIFRPIANIFAHKVHYKPCKFKFKDGEHALILSNHQATLDPLYLAMSFNAPVYFVSSEHIFHKGFISKLMIHTLAPIPKKKADLDAKCILEMIKVAKEGGNVAIFLEGNRTWTNSQFPIGKGIVKLVRKLDMNLVLFNLQGGFGVDPRFSNVKRNGPFTSEVKYNLSRDTIATMSDDELYDLICKALDVHDASNGELYQSPKRAEYLERMMFVCPKCGEKHTLRSEGIYVHCENCGVDIEYTENLKLKYEDKELELIEQYKNQLKLVREQAINSGDVLLEDEDVKLYDQTTGKRVLVGEGHMCLTTEKLTVGDFAFDVNDINSASVVGGTFVTINTKTKGYIAIGSDRFNPIKYVLYLDRVAPSVANRGDNYYGLNIF